MGAEVERRFVRLSESRPGILLLALALSLGVWCCRKASPAERKVVPEGVKTSSGIEMLSLPGGFFEMGSEASEDEKPVHRVRVSPFLMDRYEVTQEMYAKFPLSDPSHFKNPKNPVEQMNWRDAAEYCNRRSKAEGLEPCYDGQTWACRFEANGYRLPTEAEWEYACRAGTTGAYSFGEDGRKLGDYAWMSENGARSTHPAGSKKPNPWGLFDMHGNVGEWCNDFYSKEYYPGSPDRNPKGPDKGAERVFRGGAWNSSPDACRSSYRGGDPSIDDTCLANDAIGFRCVKRPFNQGQGQAAP